MFSLGLHSPQSLILCTLTDFWLSLLFSICCNQKLLRDVQAAGWEFRRKQETILHSNVASVDSSIGPRISQEMNSWLGYVYSSSHAYPLIEQPLGSITPNSWFLPRYKCHHCTCHCSSSQVFYLVKAIDNSLFYLGRANDAPLAACVTSSDTRELVFRKDATRPVLTWFVQVLWLKCVLFLAVGSYLDVLAGNKE